jgi:replicative DNA helicase
MVAEFTPKFSALPSLPSLPPQNIDAEESLLGAILLDSQAVRVVADRLRPEAFFISANAQIYKAALAIYAQGGTVNFISITSWLYDRDQLDKVGGQARLAEILDQTVSSINVDHYADLINDKYARRELIRAGNHIIQIGYEGFKPLPSALTEARERLEALIHSPLATGKDQDELAYNKLCERIRDIELNIGNPGLRLFKLQELAKVSGKTTKQLEAIYFMSLLAEENESLLSWKELCDKYGDEVREWILHGFLPKGVLVALHAKGGVGKTRLVYDMVYSLVNGSPWNGFPTTGQRRAIIVQTDESAGDMIDALKRRGYQEDENIKYKTRWTFEHIPQLIQDCKEFNPEVLVIDSITSVSKHSLFSENDVEYARPLLKLKDIAQEMGITIVVIHHSSKTGDARGTSAIFNSVSEVWKLERDPESKTPDSTQRLLTIEKSRSRRPTTYRLDFKPEEGEWKLLSEVGVDENNPDLPIKEQIVEFLVRNSGVRYEAQEIAHELGRPLNSIRSCCSCLAGDGIISYVRPAGMGRGKAALYFISDCHTQQSDRDHFIEPKTEKVIKGAITFLSDNHEGSEKSDRAITFFDEEKLEEGGQKKRSGDHFTPEPLPLQEKKVITLSDHESDRPPGDHFIALQNFTQECDSFSESNPPEPEEVGTSWTKAIFAAISSKPTTPPSQGEMNEIPGSEVERWAVGDLVRILRVEKKSDRHLVGRVGEIYELAMTGLRLKVGKARITCDPVDVNKIEKVKNLTDEDLEDMAESGFDDMPDLEEDQREGQAAADTIGRSEPYNSKSQEE